MANRATKRDGRPPGRPAARRRARRGGGLGRWVALLALLGLSGGAWLWVHGGGGAWRAAERWMPELPGRASREVTLYFADPRWTELVSETRRLQDPGGPVETLRALVSALAEGPRGGGAAVLPATAELREVYLGEDGLAILDFEASSLDGLAPGGASGELLSVFALVHTVAENLPGVRSVQILVGGEERETLAGHVKISEPLTPVPQWGGQD